jgi:hypothetical protein
LNKEKEIENFNSKIETNIYSTRDKEYKTISGDGNSGFYNKVDAEDVNISEEIINGSPDNTGSNDLVNFPSKQKFPTKCPFRGELIENDLQYSAAKVEKEKFINNSTMINETHSKDDNPALKVKNFTKFARDVFDELNFARSNPCSYAKKLEKILKEQVCEKINIKILNINDMQIHLNEGKSAFQDAINFLRRQRSCGNLKASNGLKRSAEDLINIILINDGENNHSDPSFKKKILETNSRMNKYGAALGEIYEIIDTGSFDPELVVMSLIICDGDFTRRERDIIFNKACKYSTVSSGITPSNNICTVINFSEYYFEKGDKIPISIIEKFQINPK